MNNTEIIKKILKENKVAFSDDKDEEMIIESVQLVSLIVAFEEEFNIEIPDEYLLFDAMSTINKIEAMLEKVRV